MATQLAIQITDAASAHIQKLMTKQGITEGGLRVGIKGGGWGCRRARGAKRP